MIPESYVDKILERNQKEPGFPFNDWAGNLVSFYALVNIWGDVFSVAVGKKKEEYVALGDAKQDVDCYIYRVINIREKKKISVTPQNGNEVGGIFYLITNRGESEDGSDDEYDLGVVGDLDRSRLICVFHMIRHYASVEIKNEKDIEEMESLFVSNYGKYFGFSHYNPFNSPLFPITEVDDDDD